jgi:hypothetical protein
MRVHLSGPVGDAKYKVVAASGVPSSPIPKLGAMPCISEYSSHKFGRPKERGTSSGDMMSPDAKHPHRFAVFWRSIKGVFA